MAHHKRVFFALWPPPGLAAALLHSVPPDSAGRRMEAASLHLTLAFVGGVDPQQLAALQLLGASLPLPACELYLDHLAWWPHNRILHVGLRELPPALDAHVQALRAALRGAGLPCDERQAFAPHITLMRQAAATPVGPLPTALCWTPGAWSLSESLPQPARQRYRRLTSWPAV